MRRRGVWRPVAEVVHVGGDGPLGCVRGRESRGRGGGPERERGSERGSGGVVALSRHDEEEPGRQLPAWRVVAPCSALPLPVGRG